jgi:hypothetical protein
MRMRTGADLSADKPKTEERGGNAMKCYYHPEVEATGVCTDCGKAICQDCAVSVNDRVVCRKCLATGGGLNEVATVPGPPPNRLALTSMLLGLGGWLVWLLTLCFNSVIGPLIGLATMGIGLVCLIPITLVPYLGWLPAVVTGHMAIKQLSEEGSTERGRGMALTGLISGYSALGLTLISCLLLAILTVAGVSIPFIEEMIRQLGG